MVILKFTKHEHPERDPRMGNSTMYTYTMTRDGVLIGMIHHRASSLLGPVVRRTMRHMGLGYPVMVSSDEWHVKERGDALG